MEIVMNIPDEQAGNKYMHADKCIVLASGHGRLIDADALMEYCQNNINKTVDCNDIARFPTIIKADRAESEVQDADQEVDGV